MEDFIAMTLSAAAYWMWAAALVCAVAWAILDVEEQKVKDMISDGWVPVGKLRRG